MIKNNKLKLCVLIAIFVCSIYPKEVTARPISNTLKATISVISLDVSVGEGIEFDYTDINQAISKVNEGGVVKIKSGEYKMDSILSKDITLESYDGGYVDIITTSPIPENTKLKVGNKVTVNQEGVAPINLSGVIVKSEGNIPLTNNEIKIDAQQGDTVNIRLNEKIVNKLGFNDVNIMLRVSKTNGVKVETMLNSVRTVVAPQEDGVYNLGKVENYSNNMIVCFNFTSGGEYAMEFWADDGR